MDLEVHEIVPLRDPLLQQTAILALHHLRQAGRPYQSPRDHLPRPVCLLASPAPLTPTCVTPTYGCPIAYPALKKGTTPLLILALLENEPRHGYELSKQIEARSGGVVRVHAASLYPLLYTMERKRWIRGRWLEKPGERRRRFYRLTTEGRRQLEKQRTGFAEFVRAVASVARVEIEYA